MPDTNTDTQAAASEKDIATLIVKHRAEIDSIKSLDSQGQQQVFRDLGVDPKAIEDHYLALEQEAKNLRQQELPDRKKTAIMGLASMGAGAAVAFAFTRKVAFGSKIVTASAIPLTGIASGVAGTFVGSRLFSGKIREDSRKLTINAKNAFERELAVALENKAREVAAATPEQSVAANTPQRDASFAAQAAADKSAAKSMEAGRT